MSALSTSEIDRGVEHEPLSSLQLGAIPLGQEEQYKLGDELQSTLPEQLKALDLAKGFLQVHPRNKLWLGREEADLTRYGYPEHEPSPDSLYVVRSILVAIPHHRRLGNRYVNDGEADSLIIRSGIGYGESHYFKPHQADQEFDVTPLLPEGVKRMKRVLHIARVVWPDQFEKVA